MWQCKNGVRYFHLNSSDKDGNNSRPIKFINDKTESTPLKKLSVYIAK